MPVSASDFDRLTPEIALWQAYDPAVKSDLFSTALFLPSGVLLVDPIALREESLIDLLAARPVLGIVATSANHHRASLPFTDRFGVPIFAHPGAFPGERPNRFHEVGDGNEIFDEVTVIEIEGAAPGEIALHHRANGGTLIIGDALINFEPYGFMFLPGKYCSNEKAMKRSLPKLLERPAERLFFAHGAPILSGGATRLRALLENA